jgi:hypothetical protein
VRLNSILQCTTIVSWFYVLFAIKYESEHGAEEVLNPISRRAVGYILFEFLRTELGEGLGKDSVES